MSVMEEIFGKGFDRERAFRARYDSEHGDDYMICGECGEAPHVGPCHESPEDALRRRMELGNALYRMHTTN